MPTDPCSLAAPYTTHPSIRPELELDELVAPPKYHNRGQPETERPVLQMQHTQCRQPCHAWPSQPHWTSPKQLNPWHSLSMMPLVVAQVKVVRHGYRSLAALIVRREAGGMCIVKLSFLLSSRALGSVDSQGPICWGTPTLHHVAPGKWQRDCDPACQPASHAAAACEAQACVQQIYMCDADFCTGDAHASGEHGCRDDVYSGAAFEGAVHFTRQEWQGGLATMLVM